MTSHNPRQLFWAQKITYFNSSKVDGELLNKHKIKKKDFHIDP